MGTHLSFSTAFHPQSQGQVERVNQILEDMLRACVISFGKKWEESLPYAEFFEDYRTLRHTNPNLIEAGFGWAKSSDLYDDPYFILVPP